MSCWLLVLALFIKNSSSRGVSQTFLQSVIVRPTHPRPATSTTFSCQLSNTLIADPLFSFAGPGLPPICEKPLSVLWGVSVEPRLSLPGAPEEAAMPLYLPEYPMLVHAQWLSGVLYEKSVTNKYFIKTSKASLPPSVL